MKILVVDDSIAYRKTISQILSSQKDIEVVGEASHGKIALAKLKQEKVDLITLDMEMPELNGIETLKALKEENIDTKVLIFAAQTARGANDAITALELGALDIIPKPSQDFDSIDQAYKYVEDLLLPKVLELKSTFDLKEATKGIPQGNILEIRNKKEAQSFTKIEVETFIPKAIVIASSTGGPNALEVIVENIKHTPRVPILIAQHMPPVFTLSLANRLSKLSGISCVEAKNGEPVEPGRVYIAPGDYHMEVIQDGKGENQRIYLHKKPKRNDVRPCANFLFESAAKIWGNKLLGLVLTGMGADGADGAIAIKEARGAVIIQDESSSTVWGMPRAVHELGAYDKMMGIESCASLVSKLSGDVLKAISG
jgi:two-component system chemotaxis response regulator CheB